MNNTELKINEMQELEPIKFNYEEIKQELALQLQKYKNIVFEESDIQEAKKTRAYLNRLKKQVNDKKIEVKNEFIKPYTDFETKIKEIISMIDEPCLEIDKQIKAFEEKQKELKKQEILKIYEENIKDLKEILSLQKIWNEKWLNATYKIRDIELEILGTINKVKTDLKVIEDMKSEFEIQLKDKYLLTLDLTSVMQEKSRLEKIKEITESKKQQEIKIEKQEIKTENAFDNIIRNTKTRMRLTLEITEIQKQQLTRWLEQNNISYESEEI